MRILHRQDFGAKLNFTNHNCVPVADILKQFVSLYKKLKVFGKSAEKKIQVLQNLSSPDNFG